MELVPDAKEWKKWWSMRLLILSAFFQGITVAYLTLPPDWLPEIPGSLKLAFAFGALSSAGAAGVARVLKQPQVGGK